MLGTLLFLAIWHGYHPGVCMSKKIAYCSIGYFITFSLEFVALQSEETLMRLVGTTKYGLGIVAWFARNMVSIILAMFCVIFFSVVTVMPQHTHSRYWHILGAELLYDLVYRQRLGAFACNNELSVLFCAHCMYRSVSRGNFGSPQTWPKCYKGQDVLILPAQPQKIHFMFPLPNPSLIFCVFLMAFHHITYLSPSQEVRLCKYHHIPDSSNCK